MTILRMTQKGKEKFTEFLDGVKAGTEPAFPTELRTISEYAEKVGGDSAWLDSLDPEDKFSVAKGLDQIVTDLELTSAERDWGFWSWCSAYLFDVLCKRKDGKYQPGEISGWIAEPDNWRRYYRHYLASIWQVYFLHKDDEDKLRVLLHGSVNTPGELWGQIAATQSLITNGAILDAVYHLYWDKKNGERKKGAGGKSPRRFTAVLSQFERTFDFFAMTGEQIVIMLPAEFDRFKETQS